MPFGNWRFVLAKEEDFIALYAGAAKSDDFNYKHISVVSANNLPGSVVIGGGDISYICGSLKIDSMSADFGIVPNSIMEKFARMIVDQNSVKHPVEKVEIDMWYDQSISERKNPKHIEMWKKLGYEFDNQKKVIKL